MDQNEKVTDGKITKLENEVKVLKNEVQAVLLDLREISLNMENPFGSGVDPTTVQPITIAEQAPARQPRPERSSGKIQNPETGKTEKGPPAESQKPEELTPEEVAQVDSVPMAKPEPECIGPERVVPISHPEPEAQPIESPELAVRKNPKLDLVTVAGLISWVEDSYKKLGRERTEAVLDISEAMEYIPGNLRPILTKLIALASQSSSENPTRIRDYIDSLVKLNGLLSNENREEMTLLLVSLLSGDTNHG